MPSPADDAAYAPGLVAALDRSREIGFLGNGPVEDHIAHALRFAAVLGPAVPERALDLGSGGGLPGLVLAAIWSDTPFVLLDALRKRCDFLELAVARLGWTDRVTVVCERAEIAARERGLRASFALVTARSFGPPGVVAECGAPFLRTGGHLVVSEPPDRAGRWPAEGLAQLGLVLPGGSAVDDGDVDSPGVGVPTGGAEEATSGIVAQMQVLELRHLTDDRYPRRVGIPTKRPLF